MQQQKMEEFKSGEWVSEFPKEVADDLVGEEFDSLAALEGSDKEDLDSLELKCGHAAMVHAAVKAIQEQSGSGPLCEVPATVAPSMAPSVHSSLGDGGGGLWTSFCQLWDS